jgi:single-strand DNA-binding protein
MRGLNKVLIIGHLGRDPELRYTPSGKAVVSFAVETKRDWTSPDSQKHEESEWFNVVAWGNLAEICKQHLSRGQQVYIEGRLQTRGWDDAEGKRHYRTEIVANEMVVLGLRRQHFEPSHDEATSESSSDETFPFDK